MRQPTDESFSALEQEFFRAGDAISATTNEDDADIADAVAPARRSLWSRWFSRVLRLDAEPALAQVTADDDWDWRVAIARARHATNS